MENNAVFQALTNIPTGIVIFWIISIAAIIFGLVILGKKLYNLIEKYRKKRNDVESKELDFEDLKQNKEAVSESINCIASAVQQILADRLNQRIRHYYSINYIPADEFENFQDQFLAYQNVATTDKSMELRYNKCVADLPIKTKEMSQNK